MNGVFVFFAALSLCSSLGVVLSSRPLHSALWLVVHLITIAGIFAALDATFLAVSQTIVYAGAIMILVLFVIMLLGVDAIKRERSWIRLSIGGLAGGWFLILLIPLLAEQFESMTPYLLSGDTVAVGRLLFTKYLFLFEAISLVILAALLGAVVLAKKRRGI